MKTLKVLPSVVLFMVIASSANACGDCGPATTLIIMASAELVCEGEEVTLMICEKNTGNVDLYDVWIDLLANGDPVDRLFGPDGPVSSVLHPGDEWCWEVTVTVDMTSKYEVIGHGFPWLDDEDVIEYDDVTVETEPCGGTEGCTPGYWKNSPGCWECYDPEDYFSDVFETEITIGSGKKEIHNPTLMQALNGNGGGVTALARHAVAALLNACDQDIAYELSEADVIFMVLDALQFGSPPIEELKNMLDEFNNAGCLQSSDNAKIPCSPSDDEESV
jgi:hypothetical protein